MDVSHIDYPSQLHSQCIDVAFGQTVRCNASSGEQQLTSWVTLGLTIAPSSSRVCGTAEDSIVNLSCFEDTHTTFTALEKVFTWQQQEQTRRTIKAKLRDLRIEFANFFWKEKEWKNTTQGISSFQQNISIDVIFTICGEKKHLLILFSNNFTSQPR